MRTTLMKGSRLIFAPISMGGVVTALTLAANLIIFRLLQPSEAGYYTLLVAAYNTIAFVAALGQPGLLHRYYAQSEVGTYHWPFDLLTSMVISAPILVLGAVAATVLYRLTFWQGMLLLYLSLMTVILQLMARLLAAHRQFVWSTILIRLPNSLMIIAAGVMFLIPNVAGSSSLLNALALFLSLTVLLGLILLSRSAKPGILRVPYRERCHGFSFMIGQSIGVLPDHGVRAIAGALIAPELLAGFAALVLMLRPFELIRDVIGQMLFTELPKRPDFNYRQWNIIIIVVASTLGIVALIAMPVLAHWVYGGRYDAYLHLIPWFSLAGVLTLSDMLARSYLGSVAPMPVFNQYTLVSLIITSGCLVAGSVLIGSAGALGAALTIALMYIGRTITSYTFFWLARRHRTASS
jgi:hypothetical protein